MIALVQKCHSLSQIQVNLLASWEMNLHEKDAELSLLFWNLFLERKEIICCQGSKCFRFRVDPFLEGYLLTGKQTGSQKIVSHLRKWCEHVQSVSDPHSYWIQSSIGRKVPAVTFVWSRRQFKHCSSYSKKYIKSFVWKNEMWTGISCAF